VLTSSTTNRCGRNLWSINCTTRSLVGCSQIVRKRCPPTFMAC